MFIGRRIELQFYPEKIFSHQGIANETFAVVLQYSDTAHANRCVERQLRDAVAQSIPVCITRETDCQFILK